MWLLGTWYWQLMGSVREPAYSPCVTSLGGTTQPVFLLRDLDAAMLVVQDGNWHLLGLHCNVPI